MHSTVRPSDVELIVNPHSGGGRTLRHLQDVQHLLRAYDLDVTVRLTRSMSHAEELAGAAAGRGAVAVAYGGDGLAGRVAGVVSEAGGVMGLVPGGRGNDFARAIGIPRNTAGACAVIGRGLEASLDLGLAGDRAFLGIASVGFDSAVSTIANQSRLPLGRLVYSYSALAALASWTPAEFRVTVHGPSGTSVRSFAGWSVAVANSGVYGGGLKLAPHASLRDGLLDVVTAARTSKLKLLTVLPKMFLGRHMAETSIETCVATRVVLSCDRPLTLFADGEPVTELPVELSIRRAALRMLVPPGSEVLRPPG